MKKRNVAIFEGQRIRRHWDEDAGKWYFSVVDVVAALSESENPQVYWRVLKNGLLMKVQVKPLQNVTL